MKNILQSKTFWAVLVLVLNNVAAALGFEIDFGFLADGSITVKELVDWLSLALAIIGVRLGDKTLYIVNKPTDGQ